MSCRARLGKRCERRRRLWCVDHLPASDLDCDAPVTELVVALAPPGQ
ncbi:hypothetical protein Pd630_LPD17002 (plasmid) [Rhodococcus opacus PD630]|nr:hypothetical protein Pd630_LPD17002 [Rhodococcus opacus PD630]